MIALLVILQAAAITLVFTQGSLFDVFRLRGPELTRELARCPLCLGVWVGVGLASWAFGSGHLHVPEAGATWRAASPYLLGFGCMTAVLALTLKRLWEGLEALTMAFESFTAAIQREAATEGNGEAVKTEKG
jgi:hypothetical protein